MCYHIHSQSSLVNIKLSFINCSMFPAHWSTTKHLFWFASFFWCSGIQIWIQHLNWRSRMDWLFSTIWNLKVNFYWNCLNCTRLFISHVTLLIHTSLSYLMLILQTPTGKLSLLFELKCSLHQLILQAHLHMRISLLWKDFQRQCDFNCLS